MSFGEINFESNVEQVENKESVLENEKKEKNKYDGKLIEFTEELADDEKVSKDVLLASLEGLDSDKAWELRSKLVDKAFSENNDKLMDIILGYMGGLDSDKAWELRERVSKNASNLKEGYKFQGHKQFEDSFRFLVYGLEGLDNEKSWKMRDFAVENGYAGSVMLNSMRGLDSDKAWELRENEIELGHEIRWQIDGLDSDKAWEFRKKHEYDSRSIIGIDNDKANELRESDDNIVRVAHSLYGCSSEKSFEIRNKIIEEISKEFKHGYTGGDLALERLLESLGGDDSDKAWELRDRLVEEYRHKLNDERNIGLREGLIGSLSGCDSEKAWKLREKLLPIIEEKSKDRIMNNYKTIKLCENCNSERAWLLRKDVLKSGGHIGMASLSFNKSDEFKNSEIKK